MHVTTLLEGKNGPALFRATRQIPPVDWLRGSTRLQMLCRCLSRFLLPLSYDYGGAAGHPRRVNLEHPVSLADHIGTATEFVGSLWTPRISKQGEVLRLDKARPCRPV